MGRVKSVIAKANQRLNVKFAAAMLAGSTLVSSGLGLYRDRLLNGLYYDSYPVGLNAYTVAFTIPDFMFFILVSGALSVTFIPVFNQRLASGNKESAWKLSSSMINFMALITLVASVLIIIFADPLVRYVVGPGLDESGRNLAISMMRVIAVNPFLFAVATVIASMQQAIGRFTFYTLAPTIYNIGIIIGAVFFTGGIDIFGWHVFDGGIMGVALGVVLGSMMQLVVSSLGLVAMGFDYDFKIYRRNKGFRQVLRLLPARSLDQGMDYLISIVETNLASRMGDIAVRAYQQAMTLHMVPINLIGVAISTAAFPKMTEQLSRGDQVEFTKGLQTVLRVIIWFALPVSVITFFTRGYLVNFIKNGGDTLMASILGSLAIVILFRSIYHIAARSFYAQQDTKTPFYISLFSIGLNIVLAIVFTQVFYWGLHGLAWAQAIMAGIEVAILFTIMGRRSTKLFNDAFMSAVARMASATGLMAVVTYISVGIFQLQSQDQSFLATFPKFAVIVGISLGAYVWICHMMKLNEPKPIVAKLKNLLVK